jgi:hypothetical protein
MTFIAQLPTPASGAVENWLFAAAAVGSLVLIGRKLFVRPAAKDAEFVTRVEFHRELSAVSDKIDARFTALSSQCVKFP